MKQTINLSQFRDAFKRFERENFSYEGLEALFNYIKDYEENTGEEKELDVVALCCEFTEYKNLKELQENYTTIKSRQELEEHTTVIPIEGTDRFIIQDY